MTTILLLIASNTFMTLAWYGHLKYKSAPIVTTILLSWLIALPEYTLQVPANRIGHGQFTTAQLKIIQEAIAICVFIVFNLWYFDTKPDLRSGLAFLLILLAVMVAVSGSKPGE
jgi:uncharacterized protein (DUF486 family)